MSKLAAAIYKTLAFFDAQDVPLTLLEIKAYLARGESQTLSEIQNSIETELSGKVAQSGGFYFLVGREALALEREARYKISLQRFRKSGKFLFLLRFFPYLRTVAISGSQALLASDDDSDIDLFVIAKKNRIWLTRLLVSLYFQILGQRRHGNLVKNRFCLNHYVTEAHTISEDQNLYTAAIYANLLPVLGEGELVKFWQANPWIGEFVSQPWGERENIFFKFKFSRTQRLLEFVLDYSVGPALNALSGIYQKKRIKRQEHILVSDEELSLHPGSRGQQVLAKYANKLQKIGY